MANKWLKSFAAPMGWTGKQGATVEVGPKTHGALTLTQGFKQLMGSKSKNKKWGFKQLVGEG
jgi:hypothetical protein